MLDENEREIHTYAASTYVGWNRSCLSGSSCFVFPSYMLRVFNMALITYLCVLSVYKKKEKRGNREKSGRGNQYAAQMCRASEC